jgi:hypothetical protein
MQKRLTATAIAMLVSVFISSGTAFAKAKIDNVATVAPKGGDYTNPAVAMDDLAIWCGVPSAANPCLLKIFPGSYDVESNSVVMQSYVDIEGSGENVTTIIGDVGTSGSVRQGVLVGASNSEIRSLTVINNASSGNDAVGISYEFKSPNILHVTAKASGGTDTNIGVYINSGASPLTLTHVTAEGAGGTNSYGIEYVDCVPTLTNVTAKAIGGSNQSYGVFDSNDAGGHSTIEHSVLSGTTGSLLSVGFGSAYIASTRLEGIVKVGGDPNNLPPACAGVYDAAFTFYASTCPSLPAMESEAKAGSPQ